MIGISVYTVYTIILIEIAMIVTILILCKFAYTYY